LITDAHIPVDIYVAFSSLSAIADNEVPHHLLRLTRGAASPVTTVDDCYCRFRRCVPIFPVASGDHSEFTVKRVGCRSFVLPASLIFQFLWNNPGCLRYYSPFSIMPKKRYVIVTITIPITKLKNLRFISYSLHSAKIMLRVIRRPFCFYLVKPAHLCIVIFNCFNVFRSVSVVFVFCFIFISKTLMVLFSSHTPHSSMIQ